MTTIDPDPYRSTSQTSPSAEPRAKMRIWPGLLLVALFWAFVTIFGRMDMPIFAIFLSTVAASLLLLLSFSIWWLINRSVPWSERVFGYSVFAIGGILAGILADSSVGPMGLIFMGVPVVITAWAVWLLVSRGWSQRLQRIGLLAVMTAFWGSFVVSKVDGVDGASRAATRWRWSESAEDRYLAEREKTKNDAPASDVPAEPLVLQVGDWPEFRGPGRLSEVHGVKIDTDWANSPPKELWRRKIGPAWSSMLVIGDKLFTQEQRGEYETTVCLDAATGKEIWNHQDQTRFSDGQAGAGPRATPTFVDGNLYTFGASGVLDCLDAATGKLKWTRNIVADSGAPLPMWGFSSSPLVVQGKVVVFAGGPNDKGLLAYDAATGDPAWTVPTGALSYSSGQVVSRDGESQILFLSDQGLIAVDPAWGEKRWQYDSVGTGTWRTVQPRQIDQQDILIGSEDLGLVRLEVAHEGSTWTPTRRWDTRSLRPAYNDFVIHDGMIYGFDESIFCCVDAATGKRQWKAGRYGHGQVLLIADQPALLVVSESGEVVLLAANPKKLEELGRFQAVKGKTWNHPVIAHGRLFVRNDEEIAAYELKPQETP